MRKRETDFSNLKRPFNRVGRGIELTEAGYVFWRARSLSLRGWKRPNSPLNEFGSLKRGAIIVQASQTIVSYWLPLSADPDSSQQHGAGSAAPKNGTA
jgi:hypothetical protein